MAGVSEKIDVSKIIVNLFRGDSHIKKRNREKVI